MTWIPLRTAFESEALSPRLEMERRMTLIRNFRNLGKTSAENVAFVANREIWSYGELLLSGPHVTLGYWAGPSQIIDARIGVDVGFEMRVSRRSTMNSGPFAFCGVWFVADLKRHRQKPDHETRPKEFVTEGRDECLSTLGTSGGDRLHDRCQ
jgi:hypothetical protein